MAGIGFRLQALVKKGTYLGASTAYIASAVITAGPWLAGAASLFILNNTSVAYLSSSERTLLFATIVCSFAFSLMVAAGPQMLITRYLADLFYADNLKQIAPTCMGVFYLFFPLFFLTLPFLLFAPFDIRYRLLVDSLFLTLTMTWLIMIFLSAAHEYVRIVLVFVCCYGIGCGAGIALGYSKGLLGSLAGFTLGQVICLCLLISMILQEFPSRERASLEYLKYVRKYGNLCLIGGGFAVSLWIDSILFWFSGQGQIVSNFYHLFAPYDITKFAISLSTIPASVIFMIHLETNFDRHYQNFYRSIQAKGTLANLVKAREGMLAAVRKGVGIIIKVQGLVALFLCIVAGDLANVVGLSQQWIVLLRLGLIAGLFQFLTFCMLLLLLYIDRRREALLLVSCLFLCNTVFTLLTLRLGPAFYGAGDLSACILSSILGWLLLNRRLKRLEFLTFMFQPWS